MSSIKTFTISNEGTRIDFYNAIKDKFIELGFDWDEERSLLGETDQTRLVMNLSNDISIIFQDSSATNSRSLYLRVYNSNGEIQALHASSFVYANSASAPTVNTTRTLQFIWIENETDIYFNIFNYGSGTMNNAVFFIYEILKADGSFVKMINSREYFTKMYNNEKTLDITSPALYHMRNDTENILLTKAICYTNNVYYGITKNTIFSSVGLLDTKYIIDGQEYRSIFNSTSANNILIPYTEIILE